MKTPHKHAEIIKAWADGAQIEYLFQGDSFWKDIESPTWHEFCKYRIKPEPKPDVVKKIELTFDESGVCGTFKVLDVPYDTNHKAN